MVATTDITVLVAREHYTAKSLSAAVRRSQGALLLVLPPTGLPQMKDDKIAGWLKELRALHADRTLILATKNDGINAAAREQGWQVVDTLKQLKMLVAKHESRAEALRVFSPVSWRQDIRSKLQFVGLLSLPKMRIWLLFGTSILVFLYVFLRLLPSAEIRIWPNQEVENFTMNVYLAASGSTLPVPPERVHVLKLYPITVHTERTITFDQISKDFTGQNAKLPLTVINDSDEQYSLRKGTRFVNQAGMQFRLPYDLIMPSKTKQEVMALADPLDQYGEVVGARGNVPAGVRWDIPGLSDKERQVVYGRNEKPGTGGSTSYVTRVKPDDIKIARAKLEQELLAAAKAQADEDRASFNQVGSAGLTQLRYDELTKITYTDFDLSEAFIGQNVASIPIHGTIDYTVLLYDETKLLGMLKDQVLSRVEANKIILEDSLVRENLSIHVIPPWDDNLLWVKVTADLSYGQRYILSPLTPTGARFGKYIRDSVAGKSVEDAYRIIKNLPEVSKAQVTLWPPWAGNLPSIGSSIIVTENQ